MVKERGSEGVSEVGGPERPPQSSGGQLHACAHVTSSNDSSL